jgi:hypothetical protein
VKRSLTISEAKSNTDFRDIIRDSWATLANGHLEKVVDGFEDVANRVTDIVIENV